MSRRHSIFYSALMLTGVNLLIRFAGTSFQVYLSGRIGASGIGLLQLVLSVGNFCMVAGMGGIRTATMYLTAEELGKGKPGNVSRILSGCLLYSIIFSGAVSLLLQVFAPWIAQKWIGDSRTLASLRLFAAFLPCCCLCGVMSGYFTAANRVGTLALVEVAEQLVSMAVTAALLTLWAGTDPGRACLCVITGSSIGACVTLVCLVILRLLERPKAGPVIPVDQRLRRSALPLAAADNLRTGISTLENLTVPKRLALNSSIRDPLAAFGIISGMVFPVLMFPACILYGLAELLIPELARCAAAGGKDRIRYLVRRGLKSALLYSLLLCGLMHLLAQPLCRILYREPEAGNQLRRYALLIPMLYCDALTDAMIKGLGQQKISVRYNILTNILDILFLYILLPKYGLDGYYFSFLVTHLINFVLSLRLLFSITSIRIGCRKPVLALCAWFAALWAASVPSQPAFRTFCFPVLLCCLLYLCRIILQEDFVWLFSLVKNGKPKKHKTAPP